MLPALRSGSPGARVGGRPPPTPRTGIFVSTVAILALAGCGLMPKGPVRDPDARPPSPSGPPPMSSGSRRPAPPPTPTRTTSSPSPSGFQTFVAVSCNGKPTGAQVVALLRRTRVLPAQVQATVTNGPLCAGTWQYTEVAMPDAEPIDVVTQGPPEALALVTAGTDACTAGVRAGAPLGIRTVLRCDA
jgi:hypothetical protein